MSAVLINRARSRLAGQDVVIVTWLVDRSALGIRDTACGQCVAFLFVLFSCPNDSSVRMQGEQEPDQVRQEKRKCRAVNIRENSILIKAVIDVRNL